MSVALVKDNYTDAVAKGDYDLYAGNLTGKYDNVRIYWEDQLTRFQVRPFLVDIVSRKRKNKDKVRIVDLGSGTGQGYEIISKIDEQDLDLGLYHHRVLPENEIGLYLGLDLSEMMVEKGNEIYQDVPNIRFAQTDLNDGLGAIKAKEPPFDIYFSTYGSPSHLDTAHLKFLLKDICQHSLNGSLVVLDLIGRYSIEWPCYWNAKADEDKYCDYSMSYLYTDPGLEHQIEHFSLRFWTGKEVDDLVEDIRTETGIGIEILQKFDRSLMIGRHVDTREYNPNLRPIRRMVNRLHEDYMRTDLNELMLDRTMFPKHPEPLIRQHFEELITSWNILISFCQQRLEGAISLVELDGWAEFSAPLQFALMTVDRVINDTEWMWSGDPRANIIEPQLGYALRSLEADLQQGLGCGHGLLVVLKIKK